ncbi:YHYH domain-containing protein [Brucellaceae bacterium C25G]
MRTFILSLFMLSVGATAALAHSGGTDANGCHTNSKTGVYHCH